MPPLWFWVGLAVLTLLVARIIKLAHRGAAQARRHRPK
jgi:hypothetical protein